MKSEELLLKHLALNDCKGYVTSDGRLYKAIIDALEEAINYTRCSTQLKAKEIPNFYKFCCDTFKYVNKSYHCKRTGKKLTMEEMENKYKQHYKNF